jgi:hypothetical protein
MLHPHRVSLTIIILPIVVLACALPTIALQDPSAISTTAAQTVIARFTQTALSEEILPSPTQEPTFTFTPEPPTFTPTETTTPSPTLTSTPFFTATPIVPQISVSVPTNCRVGPGKVYRMVGALLVGESSNLRDRLDGPVLVHPQSRREQRVLLGLGAIRHDYRKYRSSAGLHATTDTHAYIYANALSRFRGHLHQFGHLRGLVGGDEVTKYGFDRIQVDGNNSEGYRHWRCACQLYRRFYQY